ncbi:MAG: SPOR domain-containing protein [Kiloniellaceae bacterium]
MMASDQQSERIRLVVEPAEDERSGEAENPALVSDPALQRRPEDLVEQNELAADAPIRRKRLLPATLAVVALAAFGGVIWYAYNWGVGTIDNEELPLIRAEPGPIKTRPLRPGGLDVPHQDALVLNEITPDPAKPQVERLLPPPEVPKPPKPLTAAPTGGAEGAQEAKPTAPPTPTAQSPGLQPAAGAPAPPAEAAAAEAAPAPPPPAKATQTAVAPASGSFLVQLASLKDRKGVTGEWARLQKAFPGLLGDKELAVQTVDLRGRGTFHRVRAGYFPDRASAEALCAQLKAKKQDCLVVKR